MGLLYELTSRGAWRGAWRGAVAVVLILACFGCGTDGWQKILGTTSRDLFRDVAVDSNGDFISVGYTFGAYSGAGCTCLSSGSYTHSWSSCRNTTDSLVVKFDSSGNVLWSHQECSSDTDDAAQAVITDSNKNVYIAGYTFTAISGGVQGHSGQADVYLLKYDSSGTSSTRLVTHWGGPNMDEPRDMAVDSSNNVYVTGYRYGGPTGLAQWQDMFLAKYDTSLNLLWDSVQGTANNDRGHGVAVDEDGYVFVTGVSDGKCAVWRYHPSLGGQFGPEWTSYLPIYFDDTQLQYEWSVCRGAATDGNAVYTTGITGGSVEADNLNDGWTDSFIAKFNSAGGVVWAKKIASVVNDYGRDVAVDDDKHVYVVGYTEGTIGDRNSGSWDGWVRKYNENGKYVWTDQVGGSGDDMLYGVATSGADKAYVVGFMYMQESLYSSAGLGEWDGVVFEYVDAYDYTAIIVIVVVLFVCLCIKPCICWTIAIVLVFCCGGVGGVGCRLYYKLRAIRRKRHFKPVHTGEDSD